MNLASTVAAKATSTSESFSESWRETKEVEGRYKGDFRATADLDSTPARLLESCPPKWIYPNTCILPDKGCEKKEKDRNRT